MAMKQDKYRRARGGTAKMLDISCTNCGGWLLKYQKDGPGNLLRCYLNRIFAPEKLERLQNDPTIQEPKDIPNLVCNSCKTLIGTPMRYEDGRLAFRLIKGRYSKRQLKGEE
jgi:hypothetical protein